MNTGDPIPIRSEFADDPDMAELVTEYVQRMPERINAILSAYERKEREQLIRIVHQIKGSGGGYGFPLLTTAADKLERRLLESPPNALDQVNPELQDLIQLCQRMAA